MRSHPTARMTQLAARWLTDTVTLQTQTQTAATRATMAAGGTTLGAARRHAGLVRESNVADQDDVTVDRNVRELQVWIEEDAVPVAGDRCTFTVCGDATLQGEYGTVLYVTRDSVRAVRRMTIRMGNDQ